jgi:hypothetical protein
MGIFVGRFKHKAVNEQRLLPDLPIRGHFFSNPEVTRRCCESNR